MLRSWFRAFNNRRNGEAAIVSKQVHGSQSDLLHFFFKSSIHWSSRSRASLHNYHLRKRRKWPLSPYKTKWDQTFGHQLAMKTFKEAAQRTPKTHLLSALVASFAAYGCDPTPNAYHFIFKTLTKTPSAIYWDQVRQVLDHLQKAAVFETPEYIFIDLIKYCGDCNKTRHAVELFFRIPNFRCNPSVNSLNALLSVLCNPKSCGLEMVPSILIKSQMLNIRLESSSLDILIRALCRNGKVGRAFELLNYAVFCEGFDVNPRVFSFILATICEGKMRDGIDILGFLGDLKKLGFIPDKADWCNIIRFMVNNGNATEAMAALNQMKREGIEPDIVSCNRVLDGLVVDGEYVKADQLFDQMLVVGLVPDIFTYNAYISGLCKQNNLEKGIRILSSMEELGCVPDSTTYNTILSACLQKGEMSPARAVIRKMESKGVKLNLQTFEGTIDASCNNYQIEED